MDQLDVRILRAIISESAVAPTNTQIISSIRKIAKDLGADDMTVAKRIKKLQDAGSMDKWQLSVNPSFLGYRMADVLLDVGQEFAKPDMMRKLALVHGVLVIINFLGKAMKVTFVYNGEEERSRTIELISRITNAELVAVSRMSLPRSETQKLTETDKEIIHSLSKDARRSTPEIARKIRVSPRTIRNRLEKLRAQKTIFMFPNLNMTNIEGFIPAVLTYSYTTPEVKPVVDEAVLSQFDSNFLWGGFWDLGRGSIVLSAPTMADVPKFLEWMKSQRGVATARVDIPFQLFSYPEKLGEMLKARREAPLPQ